MQAIVLTNLADQFVRVAVAVASRASTTHVGAISSQSRRPAQSLFADTIDSVTDEDERPHALG